MSGQRALVMCGIVHNREWISSKFIHPHVNVNNLTSILSAVSVEIETQYTLRMIKYPSNVLFYTTKYSFT